MTRTNVAPSMQNRTPAGTSVQKVRKKLPPGYPARRASRIPARIPGATSAWKMPSTASGLIISSLPNHQLASDR
jgi:hypothetical protein